MSRPGEFYQFNLPGATNLVYNLRPPVLTSEFQVSDFANSASEAGITENQYYTMVDITGPGVVTRCAASLDNSVTGDWTIKVTIDSVVVLEEAITIGGLLNDDDLTDLIGVRIARDASVDDKSLAPAPVQFESQFKVEMKFDTAGTHDFNLYYDYFLC